MKRSNVEEEFLTDGGMPSPPTAARDASPPSEAGARAVDKEYYDELTEFMKQVDEILDFIKPFPRDRNWRTGTLPRPRLQSQTSETSDHLENLIKLVEQLKDLKEKDSKMNERTQYLKELKKLRERKKLLKCESELGSSTGSNWAEVKQETEMKSRTSLPFRKGNRGRSKSVNMEDLIPDKDIRFRRERLSSDEEHKRKLSEGSQKTDKSRVSKWTKVKEAFRWEKASVDGRIQRRDDGQYLQVPQDKTPESLSDSPLSGQISGSSSVGAPSTTCLVISSGYSGEHSSEGHSTSSGCGTDIPPPPPPLPSEDDLLSLPLLQDLSSSSSSEKLDELLTYSKLLSKGNNKDETTTGSFDAAFHDAVHRSEDLEARRSKSLDGDIALGPIQNLSKESLTFSKTSKTHKTTWGKVKGIIQTRKDSLRKKPKKKCSENFQAGTDFDGSEDPFPPEDKPKEPFQGTSPKQKIELTVEPPDDQASLHLICKSSTTDSLSKKRLTPVLTITLPSTEELRSISSEETDIGSFHKATTPLAVEERSGDKFYEDIPKCEKSKSGSAHRFSKWSKVKRAFLTSPSRTPEYVPDASSAPSSPSKNISFFTDVDSDELSSGDWTEEKIPGQEKRPSGEGDSPGGVSQEEPQRRYGEKSGHDFDHKSPDWGKENHGELQKKHDFQKQKSEECDKIPRSPIQQRDSMAIPLPKLDDLSPEFKKKLDEWKKIKKSQTIPTVPATGLPKDDVQGQHFKMRIGEWQRWRPRSSHKMTKNEQSEEFAKKLDEWQRMKRTSRRSRSQSERGKDDSGNRTPSPQLQRKNSKNNLKKSSSSGKSSGMESLSGSLKEKDGRHSSRKQQKEKDLQWLEKELHKIERGKMRLEREKEKFLEREARLEKMKRTMGTTSPTQEVLIRTPTGFFRFEGISQKFTKKLYEWEKARGIAPEASTFALLEECASRNAGVTRDDSRAMGGSLQRSKSVGSVMEVSSIVQGIPHHPSSLSLNDVDDLKEEVLEESRDLDITRGSSEPTLADLDQDEEEPQAVIIDVEDVVEETAALMVDDHIVKSEVPVYSYASTEVTQFVDSSTRSGRTTHRIPEESVFSAGSRDDQHKELKILRKFGTEVRTEDIQKVREAYAATNDYPQQQRELINIPENFPAAVALPSKQQEAVSRVHELSSQLLSLAEKLEVALSDRGCDDGQKKRSNLYGQRREQGKPSRAEEASHTTDDSKDVDSGFADDPSAIQDLSQLPSLITNKVLELKCGLNVLKSATGTSSLKTPTTEFTGENSLRDEISEMYKMNVVESEKENKSRRIKNVKSEDNEECSTAAIAKGTRTVVKDSFADTSSACKYDSHHRNSFQGKQSPETIKKVIREKISLMQRMTTEARPRYLKSFDPEEQSYEKNTDDEGPDPSEPNSEDVDAKVVIVRKSGKGVKQKKMLKTRRITDTTIAYKQVGQDNKNQLEEDHLFVDAASKTYSGINNTFREVRDNCGSDQTPVNVFVPTTRKIISPVRRDSQGKTSSVLSYVIDDITTGEETGKKKSQEEPETLKAPLKPPSPTISANANATSEKRDIGIPPLPNSPMSLRKSTVKETAPSIRLMIAKYNQKMEMTAAGDPTPTSLPYAWKSPILERRLHDLTKSEIQKSASAGVIRNGDSGKSPQDSHSGILKSFSLGVVKAEKSENEGKEPEQMTPSTLRALRLKRAKEEFLSRGPGGESWSSEVSSPTTESAPFDSNRLSHLSIGSESSCDDGFDSTLIKSASAGAVNVQERSPEGPEDISRTTAEENPAAKSASKFGISSIKSRFRKVRMKKTKEKNGGKAGAVSQLCRQSLFLELNNGSERANPCSSKSCPSSPVLERGRTRSEDVGSWIKNPARKIFGTRDSLPEDAR